MGLFWLHKVTQIQCNTCVKQCKKTRRNIMTAMKHSTVVTAPFSGNIVPLNKVPDETFASGVLGEGIAIEPSDGLFCSPVNGTVETIAGTKHAIGFVADGGLEILVHVGLETVSTEGP